MTLKESHEPKTPPRPTRSLSVRARRPSLIPAGVLLAVLAIGVPASPCGQRYFPCLGRKGPQKTGSFFGKQLLQLPGELRRELSFTDETFDEVSAQIKIEEQELDWLAARQRSPVRDRSSCHGSTGVTL